MVDVLNDALVSGPRGAPDAFLRVGVGPEVVEAVGACSLDCLDSLGGVGEVAPKRPVTSA